MRSEKWECWAIWDVRVPSAGLLAVCARLCPCSVPEALLRHGSRPCPVLLRSVGREPLTRPFRLGSNVFLDEIRHPLGEDTEVMNE